MLSFFFFFSLWISMKFFFLLKYLWYSYIHAHAHDILCHNIKCCHLYCFIFFHVWFISLDGEMLELSMTLNYFCVVMKLAYWFSRRKERNFGSQKIYLIFFFFLETLYILFIIVQIIPRIFYSIFNKIFNWVPWIFG